MGSVGQPHVAFIAFPFSSHPATLFALTKALAAAAPSAAFSFLTSARSLPSLPRSPDAANIHFVPIADGTTPDAPPGGHIDDMIATFLAATPGNLKEGLDAAAAAVGAPVSSVVSDGFLWMVGDITKVLGVPWVPVRTGGPSAFLGHLYTDLLRNAVGVNDESKAEEPLDFVPGLAGYLAGDLPEGVVSGRINSPMSVLLHRMAQQLPKAASAVVCNTFQGLDPAIDANLAAMFPKYLPLGPFKLLVPPTSERPASDPNGCLTWLEGRAPASVVYVSFGSLMTPPPTELSELAEGLESSGAPFLWSLKDNAREQLPPGFLERTKERALVMNWSPQMEVLGHPAVGAFVTHCGWNSVLEAITAGVPLVCRPFFGDQLSNARAVSSIYEIGFGFHEGTITKDGVVKALEVVLKGEEGKRMRARARELKDTVSRAVAPGGSLAENLKSLLVVCGCQQ